MTRILSALFLICTLALAACDGTGGAEPQLIDRTELSDALWGLTEDIPVDILCVGGSKLRISGEDAPFIVADLDGPAIVSDLHVRMSEYQWNARSTNCEPGPLYYVIPASEADPIAIETSDPGCKFNDLATKDGTTIPANMTLHGVLQKQPEEGIQLFIYSCGN